MHTIKKKGYDVSDYMRQNKESYQNLRSGRSYLPPAVGGLPRAPLRSTRGQFVALCEMQGNRRLQARSELHRSVGCQTNPCQNYANGADIRDRARSRFC